MTVLETKATSLRAAYREIGLEILDRGRRVSPRGRGTTELSPAVLSFEDPLDALPTGVGRGVVAPLAAVEALSLIAGEADPALFVAASPHYANFVDPQSGELEVAYGPRLHGQMVWAEVRLRGDSDSRQAHVDLWRTHADGPGLRAYPCVVSCGFQIRDDELECYVEMRSNDFWLGLPYDAFAFGQLQATLANVLGVGLGWYHHYVRSLHIYDDDARKVHDLARPLPRSGPRLPYAGIHGAHMNDAALRAQALLRGHSLPTMTDSEFAYLTVMREKVLPKVRR